MSKNEQTPPLPEAEKVQKKDSVVGRLITNAIFLVLYLLFWASPFFLEGNFIIAIAGTAVLVLLTWLVPYFRRSSWLRWWAYLGIIDIAFDVYSMMNGG